MTTRTLWLPCLLLLGACSAREREAAPTDSQPAEPSSVAGTTDEAAPTSAPAEPEPKPTSEAVEPAKAERGYSPYAGRHYPTQVYWGDTHLHTSNSLDARAFGVTLGPEQAYRFARGEEVVASHGQPVKLARPLDWLVIADHSDGLGAMNEIIAGKADLVVDPVVADWSRRIRAGGDEALGATMDVINSFALGTLPKVLINPQFTQKVWDRYLALAEQYNEPGRFTTLIGYEWTSTPDGNNLHRNVIYRDGASHAAQVLPYTAAASFDPEDLWAWMGDYEAKTGGQVLAIAHNGNLSNGLMFPVERNPATGAPLTADYARQRARWEPLYEITQIKGDGETHPVLSPNDEFADYETWDQGNLNLSVAKTDAMLPFEYARRALESGLVVAERLGTNPYQFGLVGSTDAHTALSTADEDNFFGKHSGNEPDPNRAAHIIGQFGARKYDGWKMAASGYTGVWAEDNTREAIFDALLRKEVYATTGPRMIVRLFGGWSFEPDDAKLRLPAEAGYAKGVPMGAELKPAPSPADAGPGGRGLAPSFLVLALRDPIGANLDRIQIVKGWVGADGAAHEQVYDVVWSDPDTRKPGPDGKLPPVGDTVDTKRATWTNTIGAPELITVWVDPEFDPSQRAFYYARVLEIPSPRWTDYDQQRMGAKLPAAAPLTTVERAYTSPIWYTPAPARPASEPAGGRAP